MFQLKTLARIAEVPVTTLSGWLGRNQIPGIPPSDGNPRGGGRLFDVPEAMLVLGFAEMVRRGMKPRYAHDIVEQMLTYRGALPRWIVVGFMQHGIVWKGCAGLGQLDQLFPEYDETPPTSIYILDCAQLLERLKQAKLAAPEAADA